LADEQTPIRHLHVGCNVLAFNIRHAPAPQSSRSGHKLLIKPSLDAINDVKRTLKGLWCKHVGSPPVAVINAINPRIRGWCNDCRRGVSKEVLNDLDRFM
jgi:RNA-directed DNA polymerase